MKNLTIITALLAALFFSCQSDSTAFEQKIASKLKELYEHEAGPYVIYQPESTIFMEVDSTSEDNWKFKVMHTCSFRKKGDNVTYGQKTETFTGEYLKEKKLLSFYSIK